MRQIFLLRRCSEKRQGSHTIIIIIMQCSVCAFCCQMKLARGLDILILWLLCARHRNDLGAVASAVAENICTHGHRLAHVLPVDNGEFARCNDRKTSGDVCKLHTESNVQCFLSCDAAIARQRNTCCWLQSCTDPAWRPLDLVILALVEHAEHTGSTDVLGSCRGAEGTVLA